jgi:hypothetical protein
MLYLADARATCHSATGDNNCMLDGSHHCPVLAMWVRRAAARRRFGKETARYAVKEDHNDVCHRNETILVAVAIVCSLRSRGGSKRLAMCLLAFKLRDRPAWALSGEARHDNSQSKFRVSAVRTADSGTRYQLAPLRLLPLLGCRDNNAPGDDSAADNVSAATMLNNTTKMTATYTLSGMRLTASCGSSMSASGLNARNEARHKCWATTGRDPGRACQKTFRRT